MWSLDFLQYESDVIHYFQTRILRVHLFLYALRGHVNSLYEYILLPTALDVKLCLVTNGHLCMFDQPLYPVEHINWCIYALFINDQN